MSEKETIELGKKFAKELKGGEVILLIGDLGAGKTTFVKGVAKGLGIKKEITSPTFVIMKIYAVKGQGALRQAQDKARGKGQRLIIKNLVHVDTYRGIDINDLENIGAWEYFGEKDCVCMVEWGLGLEKFLRKKKIKVKIVKIEMIDDNVREFEIK